MCIHSLRLAPLFIAALCLLTINSALAVPERENFIHIKNAPELTFTGYVDGSYNYLVHKNKFTSQVFDRVNDLEQNGFTFQQAALTIAKEPALGLGGLVNFVVGRDANGLAPNGLNPNFFNIQNIGFVVEQAYLSYKFNTEIIKIGELLTLAGLEQYNYTKTMNFSRSILDGYAQPGVHLGVRGLHIVNHEITIIAGIGNGWNTIKHAARQTTVDLGLQYEVGPQFSVLLNTFSGYQYLTDNINSGPTGYRNLIDLFGTYQLNKKITLAFNLDYGFQTSALLPNNIINRAVWQGLAGYIQYALSDKWSTALRGEVFDDTNGYRTGVKQNWRELTLSIAYEPINHLQCRAETRRDFSNVNSFLGRNGIQVFNNQQSFAVDLLYEF